MQYYAFAVPGLEEIAGQELAELGADVGERRRGVVFFSWDGDPQGLLALTTVEDVYALVARDTVKRAREGLEEIEALVADAELFELAVGAHRRARPKRIKRISYRVVAQRHGGRQRYMRKEARKALERAIGRRFPRRRKVEEERVAGEHRRREALDDAAARHQEAQERARSEASTAVATAVVVQLW